MNFNSENFECIRYGKNKEVQDNTKYYSDVGTAIEQEEKNQGFGSYTQSKLFI